MLRSEYRYYLALDSLGLETIPVDGLVLEDGRQSSLWLPRFDRRLRAAGLERVTGESTYSLTDTLVPRSYLGHLDAVEALVRVWRASGQEDVIQGLLDEYLLRDLLNQAVGNTDNHGRNAAMLRDGEGVRLAPIYDLVPTVMNEQGVTRAQVAGAGGAGRDHQLAGGLPAVRGMGRSGEAMARVEGKRRATAWAA